MTDLAGEYGPPCGWCRKPPADQATCTDEPCGLRPGGEYEPDGFDLMSKETLALVARDLLPKVQQLQAAVAHAQGWLGSCRCDEEDCPYDGLPDLRHAYSGRDELS